MSGGRAAIRGVLAAALVLGLAVATARPAAADHQDDQLWVTVAINAAGGDRISVSDDSYDVPSYVKLANDVAVALDLPAGSFSTHEDFDDADLKLDDRLVRPTGGGRLSYQLDTGELQVLAQREGYEALLIEVCTPRVRQLIDTLVAPQSVPAPPTSRCRGWYQPVDDPPIRAVVELAPDRERYPSALIRTVGTAAIAFAVLGIGSTLLRRGPLQRRSWSSWLLSTAAALIVAPAGWIAATLAVWLSGAAADPMLLGGGPVGEQVARTMLPGLAFVLPALLPAALLLSVPRREKEPPAPPPPPGPSPITWWPTAWWPQWAAERRPHLQPRPPPAAPYPPAGGPPPPMPPPGPPPPGDGGPGPAGPVPGASGGPSGWAPPGSGPG